MQITVELPDKVVAEFYNQVPEQHRKAYLSTLFNQILTEQLFNNQKLNIKNDVDIEMVTNDDSIDKINKVNKQPAKPNQLTDSLLPSKRQLEFLAWREKFKNDFSEAEQENWDEPWTKNKSSITVKEFAFANDCGKATE